MTDNSVRLRPLREAELERIRIWRNHPEVRRFMYTQHEISADEHRNWFQRANDDAARHLLIAERRYADTASVPFGFVNFHVVDSDASRAIWGFYLAPDASRGSGSALGEAALTYAFTTLRLHKLCGEVLKNNAPSLRFHQRLGFQQEGVLRDHYFDGKYFQSVICFGLLQHEWQSQSGECI